MSRPKGSKNKSKIIVNAETVKKNVQLQEEEVKASENVSEMPIARNRAILFSINQLFCSGR